MVVIFSAKVKKFGRSFRAIIPKEIVEEEELQAGDEIQIILPSEREEIIKNYLIK